MKLLYEFNKQLRAQAKIALTFAQNFCCSSTSYVFNMYLINGVGIEV